MAEYVISYIKSSPIFDKLEMERINASSRIHALKMAAYRACGVWFEDYDLTEDEVRELANKQHCSIEVLQI